MVETVGELEIKVTADSSEEAERQSPARRTRPKAPEALSNVPLARTRRAAQTGPTMT